MPHQRQRRTVLDRVDWERKSISREDALPLGSLWEVLLHRTRSDVRFALSLRRFHPIAATASVALAQCDCWKPPRPGCKSPPTTNEAPHPPRLPPPPTHPRPLPLHYD